jgi:hypothetical protein
MLSKSFALFVAFAAFTPAFAAPLPDVVGVTAGGLPLDDTFRLLIVFAL